MVQNKVQKIVLNKDVIDVIHIHKVVSIWKNVYAFMLKKMQYKNVINNKSRILLYIVIYFLA